MTNSNIRIGDKIRFKPTCWCSGKGGTFDANILQNGIEVTGTVDYINEEHHWYRIRYEVSGAVLHECFPISMPATPKEYERENLHNKRDPAQEPEKRKGRTSGEGLHYREKEKIDIYGGNHENNSNPEPQGRRGKDHDSDQHGSHPGRRRRQSPRD